MSELTINDSLLISLVVLFDTDDFKATLNALQHSIRIIAKRDKTATAPVTEEIIEGMTVSISLRRSPLK